MGGFLREFPFKLGKELTCERTVQAFVTTNELVRKGEARHESTFLEPKDGTKGSRKEDTLHGRKGHEPFREASTGPNVLLCPSSLSFHTRDTCVGREQNVPVL